MPYKAPPKASEVPAKPYEAWQGALQGRVKPQGAVQGALPGLIYKSILRRLEGVPGSPGKSRKEGHEDQGQAKELGGTPLAVLRSPGPPGLPSGYPLGSLELAQATSR